MTLRPHSTSPVLLIALTLVAGAQPALGQGVLRGTNAVPQQRPFLRRDLSSRALYAKILEFEDRRQFTPALAELLNRPHVGVRRRATTAIGRIGDRAGVDPLLDELRRGAESSPEVREDAVFALGEIENARAVNMLLDIISNTKESRSIRARAVEAVGKIGANAQAASALGPERVAQIAAAIAAQLPPVGVEAKGDDLLAGSLGITALLRLKQPATIPVLVAQLSSKTSVLRAWAANAIARIKPEPAAAPGAVKAL